MFEDTLTWALPFFRGTAEELMTDTWRVSRNTETVIDPLTGEESTEAETVYEGPAKLQSYEGHEASREVIMHSSIVQRMSLHFPVGQYRPQVNDVAECVASADPNLEGMVVRVTQDVPFKTHATAYRAFVDFKAI